MTKDPLARMLLSLFCPIRLTALFDRMERS
jgi:hypothetical protein